MTQPTCIFPTCSKPSRAKGLCMSHYQKQWYAANAESVRKRVRNRRALNKEIIRDAKSVPCADCGRTYPYWVMDFDHLEGHTKRFKLSSIGGRGEATLRAELDKTEAVCSNCHRQRSQRRQMKAVAESIGQAVDIVR